jgi:hypothetical protein
LSGVLAQWQRMIVVADVVIIEYFSRINAVLRSERDLANFYLTSRAVTLVYTGASPIPRCYSSYQLPARKPIVTGDGNGLQGRPYRGYDRPLPLAPVPESLPAPGSALCPEQRARTYSGEAGQAQALPGRRSRLSEYSSGPGRCHQKVWLALGCFRGARVRLQEYRKSSNGVFRLLSY